MYRHNIQPYKWIGAFILSIFILFCSVWVTFAWKTIHNGDPKDLCWHIKLLYNYVSHLIEIVTCPFNVCKEYTEISYVVFKLPNQRMHMECCTYRFMLCTSCQSHYIHDMHQWRNFGPGCPRVKMDRVPPLLRGRNVDRSQLKGGGGGLFSLSTFVGGGRIEVIVSSYRLLPSISALPAI